MRVAARAGSRSTCGRMTCATPSPSRSPARPTRIAQHMLGHANLGTTDTYLGRPRLDDIVAAVQDRPTEYEQTF